MKIAGMRKVDYYVGISVCMLLDFLRLVIGRSRSKRRVVENIESAVFFKFLGAGSIALAFPTVDRFIKGHPDSTVYFVSFPGNRGVIELLPGIKSQNILTISPANIFTLARDTLKVAWFLRRKKVSISFDLEFFSRFTSIVGLLVGAKYRVGFENENVPGFYRGHFLTHPVPYSPYLHTSQVFLSLIEAVNSGPELPHIKTTAADIPELPSLQFSKESIQQLFEKLSLDPNKALVLMNSNCTPLVPQRKWPEQNFVDLSQMLVSRRDDLQVGFVGAPSEKSEVAKTVQKIASERVVNLAGKTSIHELVMLISSAQAFFSNDSGPPHLASLTETPTFVLFGPETPQTYRPLGKNIQIFYRNLQCSPCVTAFNGKATSCADNVCVNKIEPKEVYGKLNEVLDL